MTHPSLRFLLPLAMGILAGSCGGSVESARSPSHVVSIEALRQMQLGKTTPSDVEQTFGAPDERGADGALVYRADVAVRHGNVRAETVTFRFENGTLSKLCRSERGPRS
jgi:hypothetical protein